jgi:photosystem II stability/assembly factor-like uncharacterized protein
MKFYVIVLVLLFSATSAPAQWVQANGPYGGFITAVAVNPTAAGGPTIFAGTLNAGNFRSTNNGATWTPVSNGLMFAGLYFGATTFAAKGTSIFAGTAGGVFLSNDNGANWTATTLATSTLSLVVNGNDVFAGTSGAGVYRSTNNGTSWTPINTGLTPTRINALAVSGTSIFAGSETAGTFVTTNNGANWSPANTGITTLAVKTLAVNGTTLFAGSLSGIYRSTDNGASWSRVSTNITTSLLVSGTTLYAGAANGVLISTDNGGTWTPTGAGLSGTVSSLAFNGSTLFAGTSTFFAGVYKSTNGGALWTGSSLGVAATHIRSFLYKANGTGGFDLFAGTNENSLYRSTDNGISWITINTGLTNASVEAIGHNGTDLFVGGFSGVYRSTDNGTTWSAANTGLPAATTMRTFASLGSSVFVGSSAGVHRSTNNGANWTLMNSGLGSGAAQILAVSGSNLYAAGNGLYLSTNAGASWSSIGAGITSTSINAITFIGTDIVVGTGTAGVFRSTNNGASWTAVNTGLTSSSVYSLTSFGTNLIAGVGFGVYVSTNRGSNWTAINTGLPSNLNLFFPVIYTLSAVPSGANFMIYAGTAGLGLWRRPSTEITSVKLTSPVIPATFSLEQNYPNPFNPTTNIEFRIADFARVTLIVFDGLGREVATLVNESLQAGTYTVQFDGSHLASGVYYYRLSAGEFSRTRKLVLQK